MAWKNSIRFLFKRTHDDDVKIKRVFHLQRFNSKLADDFCYKNAMPDFHLKGTTYTLFHGCYVKTTLSRVDQNDFSCRAYWQTED